MRRRIPIGVVVLPLAWLANYCGTHAQVAAVSSFAYSRPSLVELFTP